MSESSEKAYILNIRNTDQDSIAAGGPTWYSIPAIQGESVYLDQQPSQFIETNIPGAAPGYTRAGWSWIMYDEREKRNDNTYTGSLMSVYNGMKVYMSSEPRQFTNGTEGGWTWTLYDEKAASSNPDYTGSVVSVYNGANFPTMSVDGVQRNGTDIPLGAVRYSAVQNLSDEAKASARNNIDALSTGFTINNIGITNPQTNPSITLTPNDIGVVNKNLKINGISITNPTTADASISLSHSDLGSFDSALDNNSENALQNKVVTTSINNINTSINNVTTQIVRPNLLDNWYFVGGGSQQGYGIFPVNQRGQTSYSSNDAYGFDLWKLRFDSGGSCALDSSGVTISGGSNTQAMAQTYPNGGKDLCGKTVTFSALFTSVTGEISLTIGNATTPLYVGTSLGYVNVAEAGVAKLTVTIPSTLANDYLNFIIGGGSGTAFTVTAAKLELGDTQTLAYYNGSSWILKEVPDYDIELFKCYQTYPGNNNKVVNVSLPSASWAGDDPYTQNITVSNATITAKTKADLQPDSTVINQMLDDGTMGMYVANNSGTLTAYAIGAAPASNLTVQLVLNETT